jgi:outer membrane protein assembly factor BamA
MIIMQNNLYKVLLGCLIALQSFGQKTSVPVDSTMIDSLDTINTKKITFNGYPYVFYTPETQAAFGGGGIFLFYTQDNEKLRPSKVGFGAHYTTNKQYKFTLNTTIYFKENKIVIQAPLSFGYTQDKFWGRGNNTVGTGTEDYFREDFKIQIEVQVPPLLFFADRTGFVVEYNETKIVDTLENEFLNSQEILGFEGGKLFGVGFDFVWDRRDNIFYPTSGHYQFFKFIVYSEPGDYIFTSFEVDARYYKKLAENGVLASNLYFSSVSGNVPFYKLPVLGGKSHLRGYFEGRYRDHNFLMFQSEYRQYFWKKLGFVVFAGFGDVSDEITDLNIKDLKYSFGGGLRYLFNKKENVNLRMDIGIGQDGNTGIYFGIEEAF